MTNLTCAISLGFILATFFTIFGDKNLKKKLYNLLTPSEQQIYNGIIKQRRNIYFQGLGLGFLISIIYLMTHPISNTYQTLFLLIALTFTINYFYYIFYPKKKYILQFLDTKKENQAWLNIYRSMQLRYHLGFVLGLLACGFFYHFIIFKKSLS